MTLEQITDGLAILADRLGTPALVPLDAVPPRWTPDDWLYLRGIASGLLLSAQRDLVAGHAR
jgi:hypothetical protein